MEKKKKRFFANSVMVAVITMIVVGGVLSVGYIRGWFGDKGSDAAVLADVKGIVNMTREGVTYPVEQDTPLRQYDVITCTPGGSAAIRVASGSALAIGEQAVMTGTTHTSRIPDIKKGDTDRPLSVKPEAVEAVQVCPVSDANGLPILRVSYLRSNYQAFCLTGNGG